MAVKYAPTKLSIPPGFQNLLEGLSREVLREQPGDIIKFSAQYFRNQLALREETGKDDAKKGENMQKLEKGEAAEVDITDPATEDAAVKIQAAFRGHQTRRSLKEQKSQMTRAEEASADDNNASKEPPPDDSQAKESPPDSSTIKDPSDDTTPPDTTKESAEEEIDLSDPAYEAAAIKIQTSFRSHKSKQQEKAAPESAQSIVANDDDVVTPEREKEPAAAADDLEVAGTENTSENAGDDTVAQEAAAIRIQSSFRGHKVRKELKASKNNVDVTESTTTMTETVAQQDTEIEEVVNVTTEDEIEVAKDGGGGQETVVASEVQDGQTEQLSAEADPAAGTDDIDLNDPEVNKAATKIQAGFRGHKVRKSMKAKQEEDSSNTALVDGVDEEQKEDEGN